MICQGSIRPRCDRVYLRCRLELGGGGGGVKFEFEFELPRREELQRS